jgi:hypothetical protein
MRCLMLAVPERAGTLRVQAPNSPSSFKVAGGVGVVG